MKSHALDKVGSVSYLFYKGFSVIDRDGIGPNPAALRTATGFTLVELSIVLVVIAVLAAVALARLWPLQAEAERTALENTIGVLRSTIGINVASYIAKDDLRGIRSLVGSNPMDLLTEIPPGYRGVLSGDGLAAIKGGEWFFDRQRGELVYRVLNAEGFRGGSGSPDEARFAIRPVYEDRNRNGRFDDGDAFYGVRLEAMTPYHWVRE